MQQFDIQTDIALDAQEAFSYVIERFFKYKTSYQLILIGQFVYRQTTQCSFEIAHNISEFLKVNMANVSDNQESRISPYICLVAFQSMTKQEMQTAKLYSIDDVVAMPIFKAKAQ